MKKNPLIRMLNSSKCVEIGHFARSDLNHTDQWIRKDRIYSSPLLLATVAEEMALQLFAIAGGKPIDVVVAPPVGAVALASSVAAHLTWLQKRVKDEVRMVFPREVSAEKTSFRFTGSFSKVIADKTIALVDAVGSTGGVMRALETAIIEARGKFIFSGVIWASSDYRTTMDSTRSISLAFCEAPSWLPEDCPMCKDLEKPINVAHGYGAAYLVKMRLLEATKESERIGRRS